MVLAVATAPISDTTVARLVPASALQPLGPTHGEPERCIGSARPRFVILDGGVKRRFFEQGSVENRGPRSLDDTEHIRGDYIEALHACASTEEDPCIAQRSRAGIAKERGEAATDERIGSVGV